MGKIENTDDIIKAVANSKYYRLSRDEMWEKNIELDVEIESLRKQVKELKENTEVKFLQKLKVDMLEYFRESGNNCLTIENIDAKIKSLLGGD